VLASHQIGGTSSFNVEWICGSAVADAEEFFRDKRSSTAFAKNYQDRRGAARRPVQQDAARGCVSDADCYEWQIALVNYSLELHDRAPEKVDIEACGSRRRSREDHGHGGWRPPLRTFTHLMGYSSNYYTYSLSKVIALDFFNQFDKKNLLDGPTAMR